MAAGGPREAIQTLLSILNDLGFPKLPSEVFRQAKFNHPSAYSDILRVLYRLISIQRFIHDHDKDRSGCYNQLLTTQEIMSAVPEELPNEDWMLLFVQKFLYQMGYTNSGIFQPEVCSSRELLLSLGWFIFKSNIMQRLKNCIMQSSKLSQLPDKQALDGVLANIKLEYIKTSLELQDSVSHCLSNKTLAGSHDVLHELILIKGRLSRHLKTLERTVCTYKEQEKRVLTSSRGRIGVYEGHLLTHHDVCSLQCKHLELHVLLLTSFLKWEGLAPVFGRWMESVAELREREQVSNDIQTLSVGVLKQRVEELQVMISRFIRDNDSYFETIRKHRIPEESAAIVTNDALVVALKGLKKHQIDLIDLKKLRTLFGSFNEYFTITNDCLLPEMKKEVEKKRSQVLTELRSIQDSVPNSISVELTPHGFNHGKKFT